MESKRDKYLNENVFTPDGFGMDVITFGKAKDLSDIAYYEGRIEVFKGLLQNYNESKVKPFGIDFKLTIEKIVDALEKEFNREYKF